MSHSRLKLPPLPTRACKWCGVIFQPSRKNCRVQACSISCGKRTLPEANPRACEGCGSIFTPIRKKDKARFCSRKCTLKVIQPLAVIAASTQESREKNALSQRKKGKQKSYAKVDGRHAHRTIAEQKIGRLLGPKEVVHHIDGNRRNNAPENLEVLTQGEHMRRHGIGIPGVTLWWKLWEKRHVANKKG